MKINVKISENTARELIRHIEMANNEGVYDDSVTILNNKLKKVIER